MQTWIAKLLHFLNRIGNGFVNLLVKVSLRLRHGFDEVRSVTMPRAGDVQVLTGKLEELV
ncbi:hypothetical protein D3C86_1885020 [compost metagenome]